MRNAPDLRERFLYVAAESSAQKYRQPPNISQKTEKVGFYVFYIMFRSQSTGGIAMKENEITNNYEIHMCRGKELAAHMRCSYVNEDVVIIQKLQFFSAQPSSQSNSHIHI